MFRLFTRLSKLVRNLRTILSDVSFVVGLWRRRVGLAAENLFLRKQLALFREREKKALPASPADRLVFSKLARWFDCRSALVIVKPATLIGWHRTASPLLALEIETRWEAMCDGRTQRADSPFSGRESNLGRATHC
jgi:hypothetical protein